MTGIIPIWSYLLMLFIETGRLWIHLPQTPLGQTLASFIMIMGYGIFAVPTGIVTSELTRATYRKASTNTCPNCLTQDHEVDAQFCKHCGTKL
jgi:voltage-gated potassium channel